MTVRVILGVKANSGTGDGVRTRTTWVGIGK